VPPGQTSSARGNDFLPSPSFEVSKRMTKVVQSARLGRCECQTGSADVKVLNLQPTLPDF
jgi:hypothetical protein